MEWILFSVFVIGFLSYMAYYFASKMYSHIFYGLYLNKFNSHYFNLGISCEHSHAENGQCYDSLSIGCLFLVFNIIFIDYEEGDLQETA